jgi:hypothetical protein
MVSITQNAADAISFGYSCQATFTMNTSRKDGKLYREQAKTMEMFMR